MYCVVFNALAPCACALRRRVRVVRALRICRFVMFYALRRVALAHSLVCRLCRYFGLLCGCVVVWLHGCVVLWLCVAWFCCCAVWFCCCVVVCLCVFVFVWLCDSVIVCLYVFCDVFVFFMIYIYVFLFLCGYGFVVVVVWLCLLCGFVFVCFGIFMIL